MGNCQAAEAATVVIQHPGNRVDRIYWSVTAHEVMNSNPGHYVALVVSSPVVARTENGVPVKQLKLLKPDDTLLMGQVYRLVSIEDVLKEFAAKRCVKLGKLLKESGGLNLEPKRKMAEAVPKLKPKLSNGNSAKTEQGDYRKGSGSSSSSGGSAGGNRGVGRHYGGGQWKPALQSIAEIGN